MDGHHAVIESLLTKVSMAIRAITDACPDDEPFQSPEFLRPKSLHVTTCFLGSTIGDAQRKVLAASKSSLSLNGLVSIFLIVMLGFQARQIKAGFQCCMPTALPEHNSEYSGPGGPIVGVSLDPGLSPKMRPLTAASHTLWLLQARWLGAIAFSKPGRQSTCVEVRWPSLWWTDRGWSAFSPENGTFSEFPFHFCPNRVLALQMCTISWFQTASCAGCVGMVCRWLKSKGWTGLNPFPTRTV